jgi:hypothetical protein
MKFSNGLLAGMLLAVAVPVCAQSLGEVAKREAERRKTAPPAAKTYTNDDLKKLPPMPETVATPSTPANAADAAKPGDPAKPADTKVDAAKEGEPAKDEKFWRGRITAAREEIVRNEMARDAFQTKINALTADFVGRDDPYQRAKIADDRQKALAELARLTTEIEKGSKTIAAIEEEARRAGVPAGWLR